MYAQIPPTSEIHQRRKSTTMRMQPREFSPNRRRKPKRRAERSVFEALAVINRRGFCYYEWRRGYERIELDFAVWIEVLGRFALQVKGGIYRLIDGQWYLKKRDGLQSIRSCPLDETKLAALDLHDDIVECACTPYNPFVIPALVFPDMEPDVAIASLAKRKGVYVIWGTGNLLHDLEDIVRSRRVSEALSAERIAREVYAVTDGQIRLEVPAGEETGKRPGRLLALSLSVGGRKVLQVRAEEMRLRFEACNGPRGKP